MLDETPETTETPATPAAESDPGASTGTDAQPTTGVTTRKRAASTKKAAAKRAPAKKTARKTAAKKTAAGADVPLELGLDDATAGEAAASEAVTAPRTRTRKKAAAKAAAPPDAPESDAPESGEPTESPETAPATRTPRKTTRTRKKAAAADPFAVVAETSGQTPPVPAFESPVDAEEDAEEEVEGVEGAEGASVGTALLFQPPTVTVTRRTRKRAVAPALIAEEELDDLDLSDELGNELGNELGDEDDADDFDDAPDSAEPGDDEESAEADGSDDGGDDGSDGLAPSRRRRRRGGRRRRRSSDDDTESGPDGRASRTRGAGDGDDEDADDSDADGADGADGSSGPDSADEGEGTTSSRRRRRRRRAGDDGGDSADDPENTVVRVRRGRSAEDQITSVAGSTRLEAKKQRRREGREAGRRRAPIVSEAEFLARRESVDRVMVIRQREDLTQIAVLEDKVLVEHYVARESQTSLIGNIYLGRVQNVLPSMEAAFIDIGKGRNAVLYAGEVNWSALGHPDGQPRKIESVLSSGQSVLVQVTKDPVGHKGARLTGQISLAGRFLVYVPDGTNSGISRKLPDTERNRLKTLLKEIVPDTAGVIVRTAAEGASEDELTRDVERLKARWDDITVKAKNGAPKLLYGEPDLTLKVVRDLFTEDFSRLVIEGDDAWDTVHGYVMHVAPDLESRIERYERPESGPGAAKDVFAAYRIDEQVNKGLDRKVWLPSGGSLIIDRTEAMTVVDVNTGKFTGSGGNLEETVTKNNLEAAEEIVRQLRLRDIGGIIVVDFIDMVLESNRDLVLRRLVECLGRDRTRHQVAEVTSLGLVQMTRKRIGTGLLESFSTDCKECSGRGVVVHGAPVEQRSGVEDDSRRTSRRRGGRGRGDSANGGSGGSGGTDTPGSAPAGPATPPSPKDVAAIARPEADRPEVDPTVEAETPQVEPAAAADPAAAASPALTRTRRGRRGGSRAAGAPQPADQPADQPTDQPAGQATEPPEPSEPAEASVPPESPESPESPQPEPAVPDSGVDPAQETGAGAAVESGGSRVVTRTRRRASRPAGPPAGPGGAEATDVLMPATRFDREQGGDVIETPPPPVVEHVPIKRKGTRKR